MAEDGRLAVVGGLIEWGTLNPSIALLWDQLGEAPGTSATVHLPPDFAGMVLSGDAIGVYHYASSLTTPPCSEGVQWFIRRTPTQLSREQIATFTTVYGHNNRPVQPLKGRTLYMDEDPDLSIH